jgi:hypothetical protein
MAHLPAQTRVSPEAPLGATALLRVGGLPAAAWTVGGAVHLFDAAARLADDTGRLTARARALAGRLGTEVVPHPLLDAAGRGAVLALRRRLHAGAPPRDADCALLRHSPAVPPDLVEQAHVLLQEAGAVRAAEDGLRQALAAEQHRVAEQVWRTARSSPVLQAFLDSAAPGLAEDIARRHASGESWSDKSLRKRAAFLWRIVGRAAAKTTPRGWAGQIAAVPVVCKPGERPSLLAPGTALGALAALAVENVHLVRARTALPDLRTAAPETVLAPAPLHFAEPPGDEAGDAPGQLRCYAVDPRAPDRLRQVVLRRTPVLEAVLSELADGPRTLGDLEQVLPALTARAGRPAPAPAVVRGFLQHLHSLGVVQICRAPRQHRSGWLPAGRVARAGALPREPEDGGAGTWFLDSYRRAGRDAAVSGRAVDRVARGLRIAARVAALRAADDAAGTWWSHPEFGEVTDRPRPVGEILAARLAAGVPPPAPRRYTGWAPARDRAGGYARLLDHLDAAARSGAASVDIDDDLLDALGAPRDGVLPPWPVDCLLRPLPCPGGRGPVAVLETASPAGVLDARFADGLRALYGGYGNSDAYRAFLAAVERRTGVRFVDLLVPPLTERSANAVRRPVTTGWWTGDPDPAPYYGDSGRQARHLPLDRISLRRSNGRVVAEADGRRIVPVYHATRSPAPPYDTLVRLLLAASHPAASWLVRLDALDGALPERDRLPRLTAGGDLVLAPATWRIGCDRLWRPGDDLLTKVRTLALLRRATGLPRHAFARTAPGGKPVPVDLASVTAIPLIERLCAREAGGALLVEEMLPAPEDLLVRDPLHDGAALAAQLLLRLPHDVGADRLAAAAADALMRDGRTDVPGPPAGRPAGAAHTR